MNLFAIHIFGKTKVIETIVTVVYKQGHLVLGFSAYLSQVYSIFAKNDPLIKPRECIETGYILRN